MAISFQRYVDITSGVGGGSAVAQRDFIARLFTTNPLLPTESFIEFDNAADVGDYFGFTSEEYKRAQFYFSFISKNITAPDKISFARWADVETAPLIYGKVETPLLSSFTVITNGDFTLQMGAFSHHFTAIDLSGAASLAAVAADIQTAINSFSGGGTLFTAATVSWNSARGSFDLVGGETGAATISVTAGVTNDLASLLGWLSGAILSDGVAAETITETLTNSDQASTNFGSFCFMNTGQYASGSITLAGAPAVGNTITVNGTTITYVATGAVGDQINVTGTAQLSADALFTFLEGLGGANYVQNGTVITITALTRGAAGNGFTLAKASTAITLSGASLTGGTDMGLNLTQVTEAATWNAGLNVKYRYDVPVTADNATVWSGALIDLAGVELSLSPIVGEYPEMFPEAIQAATDYNSRNSVQNYMFQQTTLTPSVTTDADANFYDALRINYYGQTQTAGQFISFYQRGFLMGQATDPVDMGVYANEAWFKDAAGAQIMGLLLALSQVPANTTGRSQLIATLQSVIAVAVFNGTISVGKPLNSTQKLFITQITGDPLAYNQVQSIGYWLDCTIVSYVLNSIVQWKAVYTLIYSKDDVIRSVTGSHILI